MTSITFDGSELMTSQQDHATVTCSTSTSTSQGRININSPSMLQFAAGWVLFLVLT